MAYVAPGWAGGPVVCSASRGGGVPVIEIAALGSADRAARGRVADQIGRAASEIGMFYVRGHGIDPDLFARVHAHAAAFFALPEEVKLAYHIARSANHRGYVPFSEKGDYDDEPGERLYEAFDSALELPAYHAAARASRLMGPNVWPALPGFRRTVTEYYRAVALVGRRMCRAFEIYLGLDDGYFDRYMRTPTSQLRLLHYVENDAPSREEQMTMGAHTDYESFTLLHQWAPGLQSMTVDGRWVDVPPIPGTLVVNIGDLMEVWTNGLFVSNPHRVLNSGRERFSMPFFVAADHDAVVEPVASTVTADRPAAYGPLVAGEHLLAQLERDFPYLRSRGAPGEPIERRAEGAARPYINPFEASKLRRHEAVGQAA